MRRYSRVRKISKRNFEFGKIQNLLFVENFNNYGISGNVSELIHKWNKKNSPKRWMQRHDNNLQL